MGLGLLKRRILFPVFMLGLSTQQVCAQPFTVKSGLFDQSKTDHLGLTKATGTETVTIFKPTSTTDHYSNAVVMVGFKGYLYCQWQSSATNEDSDDTWVAYSRSQDGKTWTAPMVLSPSPSDGYCNTGGWLVVGDSLVAYINVWPAAVSPRGGYAQYRKSADGINWTAQKSVLMKDGTVMKAIFEQDPHVLSNGRIVNAAHFQTGLIASPIYTDDPSGTKGWVRATFSNLSVTSDVSRELEPSTFIQNDGTVVMIFRDQNSTFYKLASSSTNQGQTWSTAELTDMPDSRAKQSAGNLPDGTVYMVNNPVNNKTRIPLAITLSKDGKVFDKAFLLRQGGTELQTQQYTGTAKTLGYSYPKSTVYQGYLYVAYSTNKEDVEYTRIPLTSLNLNNPCANGTMDVCGRCVGGTTGKTSCTSVGEMETDACSYNGVLETKNIGYKGTSYINVDNAVGTAITFNVLASNAGTAILSFRYANGGVNDRPAQVSLNGSILPNNLSFPVTADFTTWSTVDLSMSFLKGINEIKISSTTAEGLANIDQIGYVSVGLSKGACIVTSLDNDQEMNAVKVYPNPFKEEIMMTTEDVLHYELLDVQGLLIKSGKVVRQASLGADLSKGIYLLRIVRGAEVLMQKLIKE